MSEKEFNFQEEFPSENPETELETPEEILAESEHEEVREVTLNFPESEAWPPQPETQAPSDVPPPPPNPQVKTYSEAVEELNQEGSEQEAVEKEPALTPMYNGKPANTSSQSFGGVINGTKLDGFYFYTIKHQTGITLNGKHFDAGSYWFDQATYDGIKAIDAPFQ